MTRVLVVEDDTATAQALKRALEAEGHEVLTTVYRPERAEPVSGMRLLELLREGRELAAEARKRWAGHTNVPGRCYRAM